MKKKVFSLMMTLLLAFIGVAKAEVVTIGEGTTTYYYYPVNMYFNYSLTEELYTPDEIGTAGTINAISFYYDYSSSFSMSNVTLYMKNVARESFASSTDMEPLALSDIVWTGTFSASAAGWVTITLDTPFAYDGTSNLLVAAFDGTSGYPGSSYKFRTSPCTGYKGIHWYSDSYTPDPYNTASGFSGSKSYTQYRANIQLDITPGGGAGAGDQLFAVQDGEVVDTVYVGPRPNGCWMEPFTFQIRNEGPATNVTLIDWTPQEYFTLVAPELPVHMAHNEEIDVQLATGTSTNTEWQMVALYGTGRTAAIWTIMAEPYDPAIPDVWEMAYDFGTIADGFSYQGVPSQITPTVLHNDYTLPFPEIEEGEDAVYKFTVATDMIINAYVDTLAENGKVALYTEDFNGEGGPMADNNYTGLTLGGGTSMPFEVQIGEGTTTTGYFPFYTLYNYSISENLYLATELAEAGVTSAPMTSLSWYATNAPGYAQQGITIWMANVEDVALTTTSHIVTGMTKVYTGAMTPAIGWNEFVFNESTFSWDGHSNVLIYCQRNNGAWNSTVSWQATSSMNFTCMAYRYQDSGAYDPTIANTMYTATTRPNIIMKGGNRENTRDVVLEEGFEGGSMPTGWTQEGNGTWSVGSGDYSTSTGSATGTYNALITHGTTGNVTYLITPAMDLSNATSATVSCNYINRSWAGDIDGFGICYRVNGGAWNELFSTTTAHSTWTATGDIALQGMAANYQIGFRFTDDYGYGVGLDDIVVNATISGGGTPTPGPTPGPTPTPGIALNVSAGPVIENLPIAPGTYYLVASATQADYDVFINVDNMPCPAINAEGFAFNPQPADDEDQVEPLSVTLRWMVPEYATGWRLIFGTTYYPDPNHPQTVMYPQDGSFTDHEMANSYTVRNLWNNTNYFWRVEFNNDACPGGVSSPIWGFTTHLNVPQNLVAADYTVFNDEQIVLSWNAVQDRTYRKYNVYRDGQLIGSTQTNNINATTYTDGPLAYNMGGYTYYVTAVYDEGESAPSNTVNVKVSGYGDVNGHVYEQDGTTGIAGATVTMVGVDEFNVSHTYNFQTNSQGYYSGHIYAGTYNGSASCNGYQTINEPVQGNPIEMVYNQTTSPIDYILDENFDPVCTVIAEYYPDSLDPNSPFVKVYWGCGLPGEEIIEPFETGDFSQFDWQNDPTYPWTITTNQPYEGTYCMKSGGAGVANVVSNMTVTVDIPADGKMSFFGKISSENNWDYGYFYIDGQQMGSYTGAGSWGEKKFDITAGTHTFKWSYTKDGSVNSNDDCFYVDYITFYKRPEPAQPGWHTYCESEFNNAVGSNLTTTPSWAYEYPASFLHSTYAGWNITKVSLFSDNMYSAVGGNYTCRIYVGGTQPAAGTLVSTLTVDVPSNQNAWVDWDLTTPVNVTGNDPIWVVWTANTTVSSWPAGCCGDLNDLGTWWEGGNGWEHLTYGTWTMRQWFTNRAGRSVAVGSADNVYNAIADANPIISKLRTFSKGEESNDAICANANAVKGASIVTENTRSLDHYNVYRTNCYNDGPYTEENTVFLATVWVPDTVYIDVEWYDLPAGVYKWGVGAVYAGNRGEMIEAPINWAAPVAITRDATAENDPNPVSGEEGVRAPWDLMMTFTAPEGGHYGVAFDGNNFYTSNWGYSAATYNFYQYDLSGNMIEGFNISGCGTLRGMTYDGTYFYGVANSSTVYCVDLANHSVVSTFTSAYGAMRGITYDPERDGFWVIGNWSGNLTLIDRTGAIQFTGPAPTSASDLAYYKDENDVEHIFCFNNGDNGVYDYNITTNTMGGSVFNFNSTPGATGSSGGCTVANINGTMAFIGDLQQTPNLIAIYELREAPVGPTPGGNNLNQLAEERESETIWSNCLDKDMYLAGDVTVNVLLNSADSPEGVQVTFTNYNEYEQETYGGYDITLDESGYYAFDSFRKGEYKVNVTFEGYEPIEDSVSIWEPTDLRYVMIEIIYGVSDLYVSSTGWAMWGAQGAPVGPTPGPGGNGDTFDENLDNGQLPAGWTTIDADGDGYTWVSSANPGNYHNAGISLEGTGHNSSAHYVISGSWINQPGQALTPDNYLVSPQVNLVNGSTFSFWACAQDASYPADHFGVAVSSTGTGDWTMVDEWTMTAKSAGEMSYGRNGEMRAQGNWYQKTVDLSAYAGQKYIAIRHFNCTDQFILNVDDIALTVGAKDAEAERHLEHFKVLCTSIDGEPIFNTNVPAEQPFCQLATDDLVPGDHYICKVAAMYSTGMSDWTECEWQYIPCDNYAGTVNGVTVEGNEISWEYPGGSPTPGPGGQGDTFEVGFEGGMPAGWNVIDGNSDGYTWCMTSAIPSTWTYYASLTLDWYRTGTNAICSGSYINGVGALNPDEYLVSPQVNLANGSTFSFWAAATDASYAADHFGVFISDNGTSNWTMVNEWTLTGKGGAKAGDVRASRDGNGLRLGNWYNYTVDLSAFAGQKYIAIRHFNCSDQYIMVVDDIELTAGAKSERAAWDLMMTFTAPEAAHYGVAYDGNNFYTSNWGYSSAAHNFYKYDLAGNMLEGFEIPGCGTLRGMTYDGTYFYGVATSSTVYCVDLAAHSVVSTFTSAYGAMRGITYDPARDGFWVIGNWSGNLTLIDRTGAIQQVGPAPESASDLAYYKDENDVEHIYCFNNATNDVVDWVIGNGSMGSSVFNFSAVPGYDSGSSGGCTVGSFNGKIAFIGDIQQSPNLIGIYELRDDNTPAPTPTPTGDVLGAMIFADGEWEAFVEYPTNTYTYEGNAEEVCVRIVYNGTNTLPEGNIYFSMSCPECEPFTPAPGTCEAGEPIHGDMHDGQVRVWWGEQPAAPIAEWLYYDNGELQSSVGAGGAIYWGIMLPATSLAPYAGTSLTKVALMEYNAGGSYTLNVYVGGTTAPGTLAATQTVTTTGLADWKEVELNSPVPVDGTQNVWITFYQAGLDYPATCCNNTGDANGRWVSVDGVEWMDILEAAPTLNYTWMIRGFVTNQAKGGEIVELPEFKGEVGGELGNVVMEPKTPAFNFMNRANRVQYNVYRSTDNATYEFVGSVPYVEGQTYYEYIETPAVAGTYFYQVRALYDDDCESEPAQNAEQPELNYVQVSYDAIAENSIMAVYPNPTKGNVTIEAVGMRHITVVSTLGQVVFDADVEGDSYIMNMSQYTAGMYTVRVVTENGVSAQRITVIR